MAKRHDTDYLSISAQVHAMENRLLTRERRDRMLEAKTHEDALKVLAECGYGEVNSPDLETLGQVLSDARAQVFAQLRGSAPQPALLEVFQIKHDYHNAKVLLKAEAMGVAARHLLLPGGRFPTDAMEDEFRKGDLKHGTPIFFKAVTQAQEIISAGQDPQLADFILDKATYEEMAHIARQGESLFLQGYIRMEVDGANLRAVVRAHRMGKGSEFLTHALIPGGTVSLHTLQNAKGEELAQLFQAGPYATAVQLGVALATPGGGMLTAFERECDNVLTAYLAQARRVPFGEEVLIGYLYAREIELTAIRIIMGGRLAGLPQETIRERLRDTYG